MVPGVIIRTASIAERHPAAPAGIPQRSMVIIATQPVRGASTAIPSIAEARLVPAAVRQPMTMPTTAILMVHGRKRTIRSTSARKPAPLAAIRITNTPAIA